MPERPDGTYRESDHSLTVTARILPGDDSHVYLCLAGEIDGDSSTVLARTIDWLTASAPGAVVVDLAGLTFACSTLPNFLVRVREVLPDGAEPILWRAGPGIEGVLWVAGMATIASVRGLSPVHPGIHDYRRDWPLQPSVVSAAQTPAAHPLHQPAP